MYVTMSSSHPGSNVTLCKSPWDILYVHVHNMHGDILCLDIKRLLRSGTYAFSRVWRRRCTHRGEPSLCTTKQRGSRYSARCGMRPYNLYGRHVNSIGIGFRPNDQLLYADFCDAYSNYYTARGLFQGVIALKHLPVTRVRARLAVAQMFRKRTGPRRCVNTRIMFSPQRPYE